MPKKSGGSEVVHFYVSVCWTAHRDFSGPNYVTALIFWGGYLDSTPLGCGGLWWGGAREVMHFSQSKNADLSKEAGSALDGATYPE